jgi:hypothetical protein
MLHSSSCQELSALCELAALSDASIIENVPVEVQKIAVRLSGSGGKTMTYRRPFACWRGTMQRR